MIKFKRLQYHSNLEYKDIYFHDIYVHIDTILTYKYVEKDNDKECMIIDFKKNIINTLTPDNFTLCRKDDMEAYDNLVKLKKMK